MRKYPFLNAKIKRRMLILGTLLMLILGIGYLMYGHEKGPREMLVAERNFLVGKYDQTISALEELDLDEIDQMQRYELAYSYIQQSELNHDERQKIIKEMTFNTSDEYIDFWILVGRKQYDCALIKAKKIKNHQLVRYVFVQKIKQVKADNTLNQCQLDAKLQKLRDQADNYHKDIVAAQKSASKEKKTVFDKIED